MKITFEGNDVNKLYSDNPGIYNDLNKLIFKYKDRITDVTMQNIDMDNGSIKRVLYINQKEKFEEINEKLNIIIENQKQYLNENRIK